MPKRIQRHRAPGWTMPEGAIYVGRPTEWGNPVNRSEFKPTAADVVETYRSMAGMVAHAHPEWLEPLRGRDLACWCPLDQPCHADVLLELANA